MRVLIFLLLLGFLRGEGKKLVRIENPDNRLILKLTSYNFDIASVRPGKYIDLITDEFERNLLRGWGISFNVRRDARYGVKIDPQYHTYDEMVAELESLETYYPSIAKLYDIGDSWEKAEGGPGYIPKDIWAFKISDNVEMEEDEPAILFVGLHHAREPISVEVPLYIINYLLSNYGVLQDVTAYVDSTEIWFIPMLNPDGHRIVAEGIDEWWRKNTRDNNGNGYFDDCDGVDNNRNYPYHWGGAGSSGDPCDNIYRGTELFSEYENQALRDLVEAQRFVISHSYHSYGEEILFPWAWTSDEQAPDHALLLSIADSISSYNGYYPMQSGFLYPHGGELNDWLYSQYGVMAHTTELGTEFIPPGYQIEPICQLNLPAALFLLRRLWGSGVIGHVRDAQTGEPLEAEYIVEEIWTDVLAPRRSEPQYGRFQRLLLPGTYTFVFTKIGYEPLVIPDVTVSMTPTYLDVELNPISILISYIGVLIDDSTGGNGNGYLNPGETADIYILLQNTGQDTARNLSGVITSPDTFVSFTDSTMLFPDLPGWGDTVSSIDPVTLVLSDSIPFGHEIPFLLLLTGDGIQDTLNFSISIIPGGDFLVWDPDENHTSGPVIKGILEALGYTGFYTVDLSDYRDALGNFKVIFICLGIYPNNYVLEEDEDVQALTQYLDSGGNVYMEGGDTWYYDPPVSLHSYFGCYGIDDGSGDLGTVEGESGTFSEGMSFIYGGENNWIDHLGNLAPTAFSVFHNQNPYYVCGVANNTETYRTFASSFELGGLVDGSPPSTRSILLDSLMHFFGVTTGLKEVSSKGENFLFEIRGKNPFKGSTEFFLSLEKDLNLSIKIYDVSGRLVKNLLKGYKRAGTYRIKWDGRDEEGRILPNGVYFVNFRSSKRAITKKIVFIK
jgi:hypothetical protein